MVPGRLGRGLRLDGHTPRQLVINGALELPAQPARMFGRDAGDQHALLALEQLGRDLHHLVRRLARAKDDLGEPLPQRAVRIHLRKAKVRHRRRLELPQDFVPADAARSKLLQEFDCFRRGHARTLPRKPPPVTAKFKGNVAGVATRRCDLT